MTGEKRKARQRLHARSATACGAALLIGLSPGAHAPANAQETEQEPPHRVSVSMQIGEVPGFDVAGSTSRVDGERLRADRPQVQLSESLGAVPGLLVRDRHNFAQDLQLSVRGFGSRSTFGVRGVRLYVDGIPATLPDGQGQTSNIDLTAADRVEVLRGPFSALYGNSSGGVVQVFTEEGHGAPRAQLSTMAGSYGTWRSSAKFSGSSSGGLSYMITAGRFRTDGWRRHSGAERNNLNAKFGYTLGNGDRLTLVTNYVRARAQDPMGVTAEQAREHPREGNRALARQYSTHKNIEQTQAGLTWEHRINANHGLRVMGYAGRRNMLQYLSIPAAPQGNPTHSGGVVGFQRDYMGMDARWIGHHNIASRPLHFVAGLAWDNLREDRRGWENFVGPPGAPVYGQQGALRRDERNKVYNLDPYFQGSWELAERWRVEAGLRRSSVHFSSRDHYIHGANGDDSYRARYSKWLPTASLRFQPGPDLALYASVGRGFETPTLNELAYQVGAVGGVNTGLRPSANTSFELGLKARLGAGYLTAAVFQTRTRDEIVTLASSGGRSTYHNAGRTRRRGLELAWDHETRNHWRTQLAYTLLDARYRSSFCSPQPCAGDNQVHAGNHIPGIARQVLYASLGWVPPQGWRVGAELQAISRVYANDRNTAHAPGYMLAALHAGYGRSIGNWDLNAFARVDNLFNRRTIGSVIVNDGNGRYFEPAPGRNWIVGGSAVYRF